jgi:hypothetical protein
VYAHQAFEEAGMGNVEIDVVKKKRENKQTAQAQGFVSDTVGETIPAQEEAGEQAPGQLLTHYSPDIPSYLLHASDSQIQVGGQ